MTAFLLRFASRKGQEHSRYMRLGEGFGACGKMSAIGLAKDTITSWVSPILRYERHLSALAMVAGFGVDSITFGRIDRPGAHLIFGSYLAVAGITIAAAHALQTRADERKAAPVPAATQLAGDGSVSDAMAALPPENGTLEHAAPTERWRK